MSAINSPPPFGGHGQARPPKFKKNDIVHVIAPATSDTSLPTTSAAKPSSKALKTTPSKIPSKTASERIQQQRQTIASPSAEFIPHTIWRIHEITYSDSNNKEHDYELQPYNVCHTSAPESRLMPKRFWFNDIVKKDQTVYSVEEVKLVKEGGKVVVKYIVKDELGSESVLDGAEVETGDKREWKDFSGRGR